MFLQLQLSRAPTAAGTANPQPQWWRPIYDSFGSGLVFWGRGLSGGCFCWGETDSGPSDARGQADVGPLVGSSAVIVTRVTPNFARDPGGLVGPLLRQEHAGLGALVDCRGLCMSLGI